MPGGVFIDLKQNIIDIAPWMIPYFQGGYHEASRYAIGSSKRVFFQCPDCGTVKSKTKRICDLHKNRSIGCACKDNKSYPEKFMKNLLVQLNLEHIWGFTASWLKGYKGSRYSAIFDFYLPEYSLVIEMDGELGHGKKTWRKHDDISDTLYKDQWKDAQANAQGISVVRINADHSTVEYLQPQIQNALSSVFDLSNVNWCLCGELAVKNVVKVICQHYEQDKSIGVIALSRHFGMDKTTIRKYLVTGRKFGWCTYDEAESLYYREMNKVRSQNKRHAQLVEDVCDYYERCKPISTSDIAKKYNLSTCTVYRCLVEGHKQGLTTYTPESGRELRIANAAKIACIRQSKRIAVFKCNTYIREYGSVVELCKRGEIDFGINFSQGNVCSVARGERKLHKGYKFKYLS